jgi:16S rRNA (uracil1498-N3)-methyltransferase
MHIFLTNEIISDQINLNPEESNHCARVLRMQAGDEIGLVDGRGTFCKAHLLDVHHKMTTATVYHRQEEYGKRPFHLHLAVAPTKNIDRFEWLLEKATECGIDEITPLICEKSERRIIKPRRLEKILQAAMKQSIRAYLPKLNPAIKYADFIKQPLPDIALIAHCADGVKQNIDNTYETGKNIIAIIGPEGDFSEAEISRALSNGCKAISMGRHRLRTETAALALCIQLNTLNGLL